MGEWVVGEEEEGGESVAGKWDRRSAAALPSASTGDRRHTHTHQDSNFSTQKKKKLRAAIVESAVDWKILCTQSLE